MKKIISVITIFSFIFMLNGCVIKSKDEYDKSKDDKPQISVSIEIRCDTILNNMDSLDEKLKDSIPKDGIILEKTEMEISEDSTAYELLKKAAKENDLTLDTSGSGKTVYINGINSIKEFSCGAMSGWNYKVNATIADKGCGAYVLNDNDIVEFLYTCDLGKDIQ